MITEVVRRQGSYIMWFKRKKSISYLANRIHRGYFVLLSEGCGLNFHKRCAYSVQDNCTNQKDRRKSSLNSDDASTQVSEADV